MTGKTEMLARPPGAPPDAPDAFVAELPVKPLLLRGGTLHGAFWSPDHAFRMGGPIAAALTALWAQGAIRIDPTRSDIDPPQPDTPGVVRT